GGGGRRGGGGGGGGGGAGQVDLRPQPWGEAPPADAHLPAGEPEPALRAVPGEVDRGGVRAALSDYGVEVGAVRGHHRRPPGRGGRVRRDRPRRARPGRGRPPRGRSSG